MSTIFPGLLAISAGIVTVCVAGYEVFALWRARKVVRESSVAAAGEDQSLMAKAADEVASGDQQGDTNVTGNKTSRKAIRLNWDRIQDNWKLVTSRAKVQWGRLTDDELRLIAGRREQLAGKIQERYGVAKDESENQISDWERKADDSWFKKD